MRLRKYHGKLHDGGGLTLLSYGPFVMLVVLVGWAVFIFFPLTLTYVIHGWVGWALALPIEAIWMTFLVWSRVRDK